MTQPRNGTDGAANGSSDGPVPDGSGPGGPGGGTATAAPPAPPEAPPQKRGMKRSTRIALLIVAVLAVLAGAAFGLYYVLDTRHYVSTDNAQVDGSKIDINAPTSGTLIDWRATQGAELHDNEMVGRIRVDGGFVQPQRSIRAPADATVAVDNGVPGSYVTAGTNLATAYDLSQVYVTARVDETDVDDIRAGQRVEFTVDAFPDADFTGVVREIQSGAAGQFSLFPQSNTTGNFQKVTQVVPVKISIDDLHGLTLVPGMNVTVKIRKDS